MSQRRRSRYTVIHIVRGVEQKVVALGYSKDTLRDSLVRRGYNVLSVTPGDFRKIERRPAAVATGGAGWHLDRRALNAAAKQMGLKLPVHVKTNSKYGGKNGTYRFKPASKAPAGLRVANATAFHNIVVKSYLTPEQATATLWHELTHALQAERAGSVEAWNRFTRDQRRWPYARRPIEIEARKVSAARAHEMLAR